MQDTTQKTPMDKRGNQQTNQLTPTLQDNRLNRTTMLDSRVVVDVHVGVVRAGVGVNSKSELPKVICS